METPDELQIVDHHIEFPEIQESEQLSQDLLQSPSFSKSPQTQNEALTIIANDGQEIQQQDDAESQPVPDFAALDGFMIDFLEPDPRPTFVIKLSGKTFLPEAAETDATDKSTITRVPTTSAAASPAAPLGQAISFSTASVSTIDDLDSDFSSASTHPSSLPDLSPQPPVSEPDDESIKANAGVDIDSETKTDVDANPSLPPSAAPEPVLAYCNPAFESLPTYSDVVAVLKHGRSSSGLNDRYSAFWKWILAQSEADNGESVTPKTSSNSSATKSACFHFGMTWSRHVVKRNWIVVSTKVVQSSPPTIETAMPMAMVIPMNRADPFKNIPIPMSPPIQEVIFDFSSKSRTIFPDASATTSIDEADPENEDKTLPIIDDSPEDETFVDAPKEPGSESTLTEVDATTTCIQADEHHDQHGTLINLDTAIDRIYDSELGSDITGHRALVSEGIAHSLNQYRHRDLVQELQAVAGIFPMGMCLSSPQGAIHFVNQEWCRISGMPPTATNIRACVTDRHHIHLDDAFARLQNEDFVTFEFRTKSYGGYYEDSDGSSDYDSENEDKIMECVARGERYVVATAKAERRANGRVFRILTCLTDVTDQKRSSAAAWRRAQEAETLKRMAEHATVGMYHIDSQGRVFGANDIFFELTGQERVDLHSNTIHLWDLAYPDEENGSYQDRLQYVAVSGKSWTSEVRLKTTWMADDGYGGRRPAPRWVLATVLPIFDKDDKVTSFTGCISDISYQKWQIERERQRKEEAIESKRQQENFIDITSHEMRNPLGAIIQCADDIVNTLGKIIEDSDIMSSLSLPPLNESHHSAPDSSIISTPPPISHARTNSPEFTKHSSITGMSPRQVAHTPQARRLQMIEECMEDAETIVACAQHQKRIVDDILTLSKLDAKLLMVTAVTTDPVDMVNKALKMFEAEARRVDITLDFVIDESFNACDLSHLDFDPSRVTQVLINLLSNALKFTQGRPKRNITVRLKASSSRPEVPFSKVKFIERLSSWSPIPKVVAASTSPPAKPSETVTHAENVPLVYLLFEVEDTGKGMTEEETRSLFSRFYQANSRIHVQYGGSGLGLFISRRLTELQNGAIGVKSKTGEGSTFAFYIETKVPPLPPVDQAKPNDFEKKPPHVDRPSRKLHHEPQSIRKKSSVFAKLRARARGVKPNPAVAGLHYVLGSSNVLVVEDNSINARVTKKGLLDHGFNVDVVTNGIDAVKKLTAQCPTKAASTTLASILNNEPTASSTLQLRPPVFNSFRSRRSSASTSAGATGPGHSNSATSLTSLAATAVTAASSTSPAAGTIGMVLMDIEMPIQNGLETTQQIRQLEAEGKIVCATGGRLPIIAISGHARDEQLQKAREAGCDGVMVKPFRIPDLLETMKSVFKTMAEAAVATEDGGEIPLAIKTERQHSV
ncbi:hypothetical protein TD95_001225 [Thielaviopsis punctulata]|uniref:Histidine kinase n=1 Tax=Thielaviopsis punctulata TaxID=72032 RepID=A0A0F4ZCG8_9PEZI|nr:hypothetical protein TD95_001225 [Thielaviopsis punctulata]